MRTLLIITLLTRCLVSAAQQAPQLPFESSVVVVNGTGWPVELEVRPLTPLAGFAGARSMLGPNEHELIGTYVDEGAFVSPVKKLRVTGTVTNKRGKRRTVGVLLMEERKVDMHHKTWVYHVMSQGGRVGIGF